MALVINLFFEGKKNLVDFEEILNVLRAFYFFFFFKLMLSKNKNFADADP